MIRPSVAAPAVSIGWYEFRHAASAVVWMLDTEPGRLRKSVLKQVFQGLFLVLTKGLSFSFALDNLVKIVTIFSRA